MSGITFMQNFDLEANPDKVAQVGGDYPTKEMLSGPLPMPQPQPSYEPKQEMFPPYYNYYQNSFPVAQPPPQKQENFPQSFGVISCIEIAQHIQSCPVCSRLYKCDNSVYIIIILLLVILLIFIGKKYLD